MHIKQILYNSFFSAFGKDHQLKGPIFIIGTGRSGTHFLCSCLNEFDEISDLFGGKESPWMFSHIAESAVSDRVLGAGVLGYYRYMQKKVYPEIFLDQTHPNIWNVEQLLTWFPDAKFIAITRNVYSVVYSMSKHGGVSDWAKQHERYLKPNRFLGVTLKNKKIYEEKLSGLQRNTFRWCSHMSRVEELINLYPSSILVVEYEKLHGNMREIMDQVADFIGVSPPSNLMNFKIGSLSKKDNFSMAEIKEIDDAIALYNDV